jgi:hypothetical protein
MESPMLDELDACPQPPTKALKILHAPSAMMPPLMDFNSGLFHSASLAC